MGNANLQVNIFAVQGSKKTMLIDSGGPIQAKDTIRALSEVFELEKLDYIFLTHLDVDHVGGVADLLKLAPKARLVGSGTNLGKGSAYGISPERFAVVFPGQEIDLGDRTLTVMPSIVEDGHTHWLIDSKTKVFFTSDAFGSVHLGQPTDFAEDVPFEAFAQGFTIWHKANFNMLPLLDAARFRENLAAIRSMDIQQVASAHGPVVRKELRQLFELMAPLPTVQMPPMPPLPEIFSLAA